MSKDKKKTVKKDDRAETSSAARESEATVGAVISRVGHPIHLNEIDPKSCAGTDKEKAEERVEKLRGSLLQLQEALYAEHKRSVLIVIQAMDTGGKDGVIKKLCSGLDPNGVQLTNFKYPTPEEWDHDYLWRVHHATPRKGSIGIWNRSHYEDVLVRRVHGQISEDVWRGRCEDINSFERMLQRNGVTLLKFFLHISKEEQKERLEARLKEREKLWKFNPGDLKERELWAEYQRTYEDVINTCTSDDAPWQIIPADRKWARNLIALEIVVTKLTKLDPQYPAPTFDPGKIVVK